MKLIDANVILRFLLNDIKEQHDESVSVIKMGAFTTPEVLAEVAYVLTGYYGETREKVSECFVKLLEDVEIDHKKAMIEALNVYRDTALDFVDCILIGRNHVLGDEVFSFDGKLNKRLVSADKDSLKEKG